MERLVFKKWVTYLLSFMLVISLFLLGSDSKDMMTFLIVHAVALVVFVSSGLLLIKYGE